MNTSRRRFLKIGALASSGLILPNIESFGSNAHEPLLFDAKGVRDKNNYAGNELLNVSFELLKSWGEGLLKLQVNNPDLKGLHGGILCPACGAIHGRSGDTIFPLLFLADKTGDKKYLDAALRLYEWMENMVSLPDGSWANEISVSQWMGTTVFGAASLAESIIHFGHLLDEGTRNKWTARLIKAGDYLHDNFTIKTGNINYPISCSYTLSLIGEHFDRKRFTEKGRELAHESLQYFTKRNRLLYGEGHPVNVESPKGCYSVDLGYNVEESLPSLVMYGLLTKDDEVLDMVTASLKAHMEFMLPDGGWDNSWGTRNFKWTYWGSRTSDGCQSAFALMANREPAFYKVALQNTLLFQKCTHNHLLYGGPHYVNHGILPCVHHTLGHSKALATLLVKSDSIPDNIQGHNLVLPREQEYGVKAFEDIQTWLIAKKDWRATITGFDQEYTMKGGHATGGAMTMLWHPKTGPVIVASMNNYQLVESSNMQRDKDPFSMSLTPRFEIEVNKNRYSNSNDLKAIIDYQKNDNELRFQTHSQLVDENQNPVPGMPVSCEINYAFTDDAVVISAAYRSAKQMDGLKYILPIVSSNEEKVKVISRYQLEIEKPNGIITIQSKTPLNIRESVNGRIFNFVPGMEALPLELSGNQIEIRIGVRPLS